MYKYIRAASQPNSYTSQVLDYLTNDWLTEFKFANDRLPSYSRFGQAVDNVLEDSEMFFGKELSASQRNQIWTEVMNQIRKGVHYV